MNGKQYFKPILLTGGDYDNPLIPDDNDNPLGPGNEGGSVIGPKEQTQEP